MHLNETTYYQLSLWDEDDRILMEDFNGDNAKIDAALKANADAAAGKADAEDVAALEAAVAGKGNCRIASGTYTGNGNTGAQHPNTLTFPFEPKLLVIQNEAGAATDEYRPYEREMMLLVRPVGLFSYDGYSLNYHNIVTWSGNSVSWYGSNAVIQLNQDGDTYHYVALG